MRKVLLLALTVVAGMLLLAGPSRADTAGTSEETTTTDANGNPVTTYNNEVECGEGVAGDPTGGVAVIAADGGPEGGALVVCSDDNQLADGRVIASGGTSGGYIAADGDKSNPNEQSQGWARVNVSSSPTVQCGDSAGRLAADHPEATDGQDDCGG